jgi:hemin uptake protein HemP
MELRPADRTNRLGDDLDTHRPFGAAAINIRNVTARDEPQSEPASRPANDVSCLLHAPQVVSSRDLLIGKRVLVIQHGSEEYRLQLTRSGKLILTK